MNGATKLGKVIAKFKKMSIHDMNLVSILSKKRGSYHYWSFSFTVGINVSSVSLYPGSVPLM